MTLLIRPEHRQRFSGVLEKIFRLRQRVFVDRLGWQLPGNDGVREFDQFDLGNCYHLAVLDNDNEVRATLRITSSLEPNASCDVLQPRMGGRALPRAAHIAEGSRICLDPELPSALKHEVHLDLRAAAREFRQQMGWSHTIGVAYDSQLQRFIRTGMTIEVLCGPAMFPGDREIAIGFMAWEDPARPNALTEHLGARENCLQDPAKDPTLFSRFGDRDIA